VSYLFGNIGAVNQLDPNYIFWYGGFIFLSVYALTDLMDKNRSAIIWEIIRSGLGIYFIYTQKDWFGATSTLAGIQYAIAGYFIISIFVTSLLVYGHLREVRQQADEMARSM
jgi:hypothetical protein